MTRAADDRKPKEASNKNLRSPPRQPCRWAGREADGKQGEQRSQPPHDIRMDTIIANSRHPIAQSTRPTSRKAGRDDGRQEDTRQASRGKRRGTMTRRGASPDRKARQVDDDIDEIMITTRDEERLKRFNQIERGGDARQAMTARSLRDSQASNTDTQDEPPRNSE